MGSERFLGGNVADTPVGEADRKGEGKWGSLFLVQSELAEILRRCGQKDRRADLDGLDFDLAHGFALRVVVEQDNFSAAFYGLHADVLEYRPGVSIDAVDAAGMTLHTNQGPVTADVVNLIPRQRAG